jgi:hypothetical protein
MLVGVGHPAEQVGERGQIPGAFGLEMIERVERLAQGRHL